MDVISESSSHFSHGFAKVFAKLWADAYDELNTQAARIQNVVTQEEERFGETLDRGLELIEAERAQAQASERAIRFPARSPSGSTTRTDFRSI